MTTHAMERDRHLCLQAGMNDFVSKPFDPESLFSILAKWHQTPQVEGELVQALPAATVVPLAGIEAAVGLKHSFGKPEIYAKMLRMFLDTRAGSAAELRARLLADEWEEGARLAHSLKASAGTIGAEALAAGAFVLEQAFDARDPVACAHGLLQFESDLQTVIQGLNRHFSLDTS